MKFEDIPYRPNDGAPEWIQDFGWGSPDSYGNHTWKCLLCDVAMFSRSSMSEVQLRVKHYITAEEQVHNATPEHQQNLLLRKLSGENEST